VAFRPSRACTSLGKNGLEGFLTFIGNWIKDVTVAGRKLVWLREGREMLLNAKERVARLYGYMNLFEII